MKATSGIRAAILAASTAGCGIVSNAAASFPSDASARPAVDTPTRFDVETLNNSGICQSPITDPSTKAQLKFVRSQPGRGDYEVAVGQYGARAGELLRVDCYTYAPIGLVLRRGAS